mmetsp:Transcript_22386/g.64357  ORF Transcript_22386/g.64357 Transcript_22386/m.64357 type:complete len:204 (-) Transcript_22386:160-771(-)
MMMSAASGCRWLPAIHSNTFMPDSMLAMEPEALTTASHKLRTMRSNSASSAAPNPSGCAASPSAPIASPAMSASLARAAKPRASISAERMSSSVRDRRTCSNARMMGLASTSPAARVALRCATTRRAASDVASRTRGRSLSAANSSRRLMASKCCEEQPATDKAALVMFAMKPRSTITKLLLSCAALRRFRLHLATADRWPRP